MNGLGIELGDNDCDFEKVPPDQLCRVRVRRRVRFRQAIFKGMIRGSAKVAVMVRCNHLPQSWSLEKDAVPGTHTHGQI